MDLTEIFPKVRMRSSSHHTERTRSEVSLAGPSVARDTAVEDLVRLMARAAARDFFDEVKLAEPAP